MSAIRTSLVKRRHAYTSVDIPWDMDEATESHLLRYLRGGGIRAFATTSAHIVRLGYLPNYDDNGEDIFAYQSGSDVVVSGEGELQIFDAMGRMIATQRINGVETISLSANGVYIFRLVGSEIKTQKIVVK